MTKFTLSDLEKIIEERIAASSEESYTARLIEKGITISSKKLGEEAVETIIAANGGDKAEIIKESADLLYHLLVVLRATNISVADVMAELEARTKQSGLAEKASRSDQK
ncbi:MAG: phosphoribosyl-ATP diphosphatase [Alphaproteobacteria bacterium]|jgi:phosphoribosyl-ATP pyrophosphohydrolase|nr:phosphoribosyl-ATP diphosphatase [Alphaproteobacteria bacterium]